MTRAISVHLCTPHKHNKEAYIFTTLLNLNKFEDLAMVGGLSQNDRYRAPILPFPMMHVRHDKHMHINPI
jgi:hypothetical protein